MCHRHAGVYLIGAAGLLGCGSGAAQDSETETGNSTPPASPLSFAPLEPDPNASIPRALVMRIATERDVYRVRVQAYVENVDRVPQTRCQEADLWRVGPLAVDWPASSAFVLPLDYASSLPDGVYVEQIRSLVFSYGRGLLAFGAVQASTRPFEVAQGALRPMGAQAYFDYDYGRRPKDEYGRTMTSTPVDSKPSPPSPCLDSTPVDETPLQGAATIVDFDTWDSAGSLQPLRLNLASKTLSYQTTSSADLTLQFEIAAPSDITSSEAHVVLGGPSHLVLSPPSPRSRAEGWIAASGSAFIRSLGAGRLSVELSDVVLENALDATLRRPMAPGSIVGDWIERP
ncbi:MAG: hypothetical protein ABI895_06765 [Deltaproteobacteria bacterium]